MTSCGRIECERRIDSPANAPRLFGLQVVRETWHPYSHHDSHSTGGRLANQGWRQVNKKIELLDGKSMQITQHYCCNIEFPDATENGLNRSRYQAAPFLAFGTRASS
jgi:hypothetical protein